MTKRLGTPGGRWVCTGKKDDDDGPAVSVSELMAQTKDSLTSQMKVPTTRRCAAALQIARPWAAHAASAH